MKDIRKISRLGLVLVLLAAGLTCGLPSGYAQDSKQAEPPDGLSKVNPAVMMPAFSLPGMDGNSFSSSALQDKVVVVRFWATW